MPMTIGFGSRVRLNDWGRRDRPRLPSDREGTVLPSRHEDISQAKVLWDGLKTAGYVSAYHLDFIGAA